MIGGRTGVSKTILLNSIDNNADLEGLTKYRGSAFGPRAEAQPSQADFENELSIALLKHRAKGNSILAIEDEGHNIGSRGLPATLYQKMKEMPVLILEASLKERVTITHQEYINRWSDYLLGSLDKIRKRLLGGLQHQKLKAIMEDAITIQQQSGESELHKNWIETLLSDYYDPMYDHQIRKKQERISFRGDAATLRNYLEEINTVSSR